jgi:hypothetical protein
MKGGRERTCMARKVEAGPGLPVLLASWLFSHEFGNYFITKRGYYSYYVDNERIIYQAVYQYSASKNTEISYQKSYSGK